jgi:hypothetical protein
VAALGPFHNVSNDELLRRVNSRPLGSLAVEAERAELLSRGFSAKDFSELGSAQRAYTPLVRGAPQDATHNEQFPMAGFAAIVGIFLSMIGLYFLVVAPSETGEIVNLQRLTIGETLTICGVIFLAVAMRSRKSN